MKILFKKTWNALCVLSIAVLATACSEKVTLESLAFTNPSLSLEVEETLQLSLTTTPVDLSTEGVIYNTNDENIATISSTGLLTAVSPGKTTITATIGEVKAVATITVTAPALIGGELTSGKASFFGSSDNVVDETNVTLLSEGLSFDGDKISGSGAAVQLYFLYNTTNQAEIPSATYRIAEFNGNNFEAGTCIAGVDDLYEPQGSLIYIYNNGELTNYELIVDGSVRVSKDGENYNINADIKSSNNTELIYTFNGELNIENQIPEPFEGVDLSTATSKIINGLGNMLAIDKDIIAVDMTTEEGKFSALLCLPMTNDSTKNYEGTYTLGDWQNASDSTFLPGMLDISKKPSGTYYLYDFKEGFYTRVEFITEGKIVITDTQITLDLSNKHGKKITGTTDYIIETMDFGSPSLKRFNVNQFHK